MIHSFLPDGGAGTIAGLDLSHNRQLILGLFAWAAGHYQPHCQGKTRLYLFGEWLAGSTQALEGQLSKWAERVVTNKFDGIDLHEAMNFEKTPRGMELLKRTRDRLDGKQVGPLP